MGRTVGTRAPVGLRGREDTRERLRAAAWTVFRREGLGGTTVRAVATEAGAAVGSLYTYYPDKEALLQDLSLSALAELGREVAARRARPPVVAVAEATCAIFGAGTPGAALLPVLFRAGQTTGTDFGRRVAGRILTALGPLAGEHKAQAPAEVAARALAATSFVFGLALLDSSGLLARLEAEPECIVAAYLALTAKA